MKTLGVAGLALLFSAAMFAQQRFPGGFSTYGSKSGFGSVVFPGTGHAPVNNNPFSITNPNFANSLGGVVSGLHPFTGAPVGRRDRGAPIIVPYAYPVFMGGGYGGYYGDQPQQPNVTVIYPPQQTPVIINQIPSDTARPVMQSYVPDTSGGGVQVYQGSSQPGAAAPQAPEGQYYLIAFKDHSIYSAVGYWVDGDTLHYLTANNVHNQASVSLVDRELTAQLNQGRGVEVKLPPAR